MRWMVGNHRSTTLWDSIKDVLAIHGHGGYTTVSYVDLPDDDAPPIPSPTHRRKRNVHPRS